MFFVTYFGLQVAMAAFPGDKPLPLGLASDLECGADDIQTRKRIREERKSLPNLLCLVEYARSV